MKNLEDRLRHHQTAAKNLMLYKVVKGRCSKRTDQMAKRLQREEGIRH